MAPETDNQAFSPSPVPRGGSRPFVDVVYEPRPRYNISRIRKQVRFEIALLVAQLAFKAQLVHPKGRETTGWGWCYKSSWPQKLRKHEGDYLERVQGLPNVVELLGYGIVKVENDNDDTSVSGAGSVLPGSR